MWSTERDGGEKFSLVMKKMHQFPNHTQFNDQTTRDETKKARLPFRYVAFLLHLWKNAIRNIL